MYYNIAYWFFQERAKSRMSKGTAHLYAVDSGSLLVNNDGIDVTAKDNRDRGFVLPLSGLAQVNQPATDA
jgi:hypothetical protein